MSDDYKINRADYLLLSTLYASGCRDYYHSMTISEMIEDNSDENGNHPLGTRMTVYRKLQKLVANGYISKGIMDDHSDTYYIEDKAARIIENGGSKG